ncbi:MAG TPA: two-component system response regulator YehT [Syntrophobacteraceae bacterium]|nr:two-component system response regulator YehT [Syntrophobacteraceae bacterium]
MIRALIVDDEIHAREELEALLLETGEFAVLGKCGNALEAIPTIRRLRPEVLFLDIQMPQISGLELLSMIDAEHMPNVVFVTAFDEYALKAFEENALDYLLKPVEPRRLGKTVEKLKKRIIQGARPVYATPEIRKIPCAIAGGIKLLDLAEVEFVRSDLTGVHVVCSRAEFFTELTLRVLEQRTPLLRCHKQFLINLDQADEILLRDGLLAEIKTRSGKRVPVSRRNLKRLKERLEIG